jgi:uncharacterized protein
MTAQEQQMLQGLVERINATQLPEKDTDAEQYLQQTIGRNPDGLYILAQTVLVQQYALTQAQKQLADAKAEAEQLRQQAAQPKHSTSFLGSLLGRSEEPARPAPPPPPPPAAYAQPQYAQQPQYTPVPNPPPPPAYAPSYGAPPAYAPAAGGFGAPPSQTGGFLRGAAQTAAGVAAGALAFEGIESLMHGFGHSAGYGDMGGFGGFGGQGRPEEVVVNNYYDDNSDREDGGQLADSSFDSGNDDVADDASFDDGSDSGDDFGSGGDTFDV